MRILFSGLTSAGHVLPLLPLADAARAEHTTALLCHPEVTELVAPLEVLPAGPSLADLFTAVTRRTGGVSPKTPGPATVELFVGARLATTFDEALARAREFRPDLVVAEELDHVGPLVAAALDVPWVAHGISGGIPAPLRAPLAAAFAAEQRTRRLTVPARTAFIDPYPDLLRGATVPAPEDRLVLRPQAHDRPGPRWTPPPGVTTGPSVLLSAGTAVDEPTAMATMAATIADRGVAVVLTGVPPDRLETVSDRVLVEPFVPLAQVLPHVNAVVTAGGTGTVLGALAAGSPMVVRPFMADQPWNAARVAALGVGVRLRDDERAGEAVEKVLADTGVRDRARAAATHVAGLPGPDAVLAAVSERVGRSHRPRE